MIAVDRDGTARSADRELLGTETIQGASVSAQISNGSSAPAPQTQPAPAPAPAPAPVDPSDTDGRPG